MRLHKFAIFRKKTPKKRKFLDFFGNFCKFSQLFRDFWTFFEVFDFLGYFETMPFNAFEKRQNSSPPRQIERGRSASQPFLTRLSTFLYSYNHNLYTDLADLP